MPNTLFEISDSAFEGCSSLSGNVVLPNSLEYFGYYIFEGCDNLDKIYIRVNSSDSSKNYRKNIIDLLPDTKQTIIDLPYDFDTSGTWLESTNKTIGKPIIKNYTNGVESELIGNEGETVSLYIPSLYIEEDITVLKDNIEFDLPLINEESKYLFEESGNYTVTIRTTLGNISTINFVVNNFNLDKIEEAIKKAEETKNPDDIEIARDLVNELPESIRKDNFQDRLDSIFPNIQFDERNYSSKFDIYIKSSNKLSLSLNTSSITFEDFNGINDLEKLEAINFTVSSSLPYDINAYLTNNIIGANTKKIMDKKVLNIKKNGSNDGYKFFNNLDTPLLLSNGEIAGDNKNHSIDIMLKGGIPYEADTYKATVKLEIQQK